MGWPPSRGVEPPRRYNATAALLVQLGEPAGNSPVLGSRKIPAHLPGPPSLAAGVHATIVLLWLFIPFTNVYVGPTLALIQNLVRPKMRGVTVAILLFIANAANLILAPQLIGIASDMQSTHVPDPNQSRRLALAASALTGVWAAYHYWAAERRLNANLIAAGSIGTI